MRTAPPHPCLCCSLPDCDEKSKACGLRRALNRYYYFRRRNLPVPDNVRALYSLAWRELYGQRGASPRTPHDILRP